MERRKFLKIIGAGWILLLTKKWIKFERKSQFIRPPGAIKEEDFIYKCVRCGECIKVCPAKCLKPVSINEGVFEWGTPHIIPRQKACLVCFECSKVCPTGAIRKIKMENVKMGTAKINTEKCLVWQENKDCFVCMEVCGFIAIYKDEKGRPVVNPEKCVGCGQCEENCPVIGESAIKVTNKGEKRIKLKGGIENV